MKPFPGCNKMFVVFSIVFDLKLFVTKTSQRALLRLVFLLVV